MSTKKRILFIANEMSPYLELTEFAEIVNKLAVLSNDNNMEVRCIMPRFGVINERRHRLHEVVRLSGINVTIDNDDYPLMIKVASLPNARLQVYFLDNEDYFKRKSIFADENNKWFDDNGLRTVLFCKGALETVKKFGWPPDIIHCSGWMTGLIPMYIKSVYKKEPVFSRSKLVFTIGENTFKEKLGTAFLKLSAISDGITKKEQDLYKDTTNSALFRVGASFADAISFGAAKIDKKLTEEFSKVKGKKVLKYDEGSDLTDYLQLYTDLAK
ncbi:MAG TPA: glycogen/starch synthase [Ferruginibacter sp.]|nr:glycogen/starch synthase [Bacteroidota bacterium]MBS1925470.1 glycogen/starch synthase [Bacteroidota bacterium]MCC6692617.1 glycogen/starch synthase [Chitinophagaceae bacterium]HMT96432.1 glycogen/starch synthase [Ferruginibacter sp.]HMU24474.1 glycogen/starch synthase [Ferruginibacter sp.]